MKLTIKTLIITLLFAITPVFAGAGHSHTVSKSTIEKNAKISLEKLVKKRKLESSWKSANLTSIKKQGYISKEWVVGFKNSINKQTIYIYLTTYGKFIGANYSGD